MNVAYKYRIHPTTDQALWLSKNFGCCRFVYNQALNWRKIAYAADGTSLPYTVINKALTQIKKFYPWLREADSAALQMSLQHLDTAFKNFFEGNANYPHFKSRRSRQSYTTPCNSGQIRLGDGFLHLPKIGNVSAVIHRRPKSGWRITSATISLEPDGCYYASVLYECPDATSNNIVNQSQSIGLDMSMEHFYVDSNGEHVDYTRFYRAIESRLAREQAELSLMTKGSNNYNKQKRRIAKLHAKIKHQRSDFLHKLSYNLVQNYDIICIEDLNMKAMSSSLYLGKSVHDLGWGMFVRMLEYKALRYGKILIKVDRFYPSSKTCRSCGCVHKELALSDRLFICPECGHFIDRDWQAAMNILDEGLRVYRSGHAAAA